ncbi:VanZ family protein [Streptomyces sp. NPDC018057]|uniref:VanZ family protein n=1 Tax=unclassified Streptomyces TaxID=2593676 RepID=UPI0037A65C5D
MTLRPLTALRGRVPGRRGTGRRTAAPGAPEPRTEPAARRVRRPATEPAAEPVTEPGAERVTEPAGKPAVEVRRPAPWPLRLLAMACAFVCMVAFAVVLARLTLQPSPASVPFVHTNLRPGRSLREYADQPGLRDAVQQIGGNLLLGVPFGILVPVLAPRSRRLPRVLLLTALVMLAVEFAQGALITGRAFDIDDVILNTAGALAGHLLLGRRMGRAVHARRRRRA